MEEQLQRIEDKLDLLLEDSWKISEGTGYQKETLLDKYNKLNK